MDALKAIPGNLLPNSPLVIPFWFVKSTDPWGCVLKDVMHGIVDFFHTILRSFLYGCDVFTEPGCEDLPSLWNTVLFNSLK